MCEKIKTIGRAVLIKFDFQMCKVKNVTEHSSDIKLNMQTYVLNELQWLSICASGKQSDRLTDMASDRPALTYQRFIIIYKMLKLFSKVKNTTIVKEKLILIQISLYRFSFLSYFIFFSSFLFHAFVCLFSCGHATL